MKFLDNNWIKLFPPAIILSIALISFSGFAYYGEFQIGDEPVNPRLCSMGSAGTANTGGGFCFYNPASPAFAPAPFLSAEFGQIPGEMSRSLIETAWMFPQWFVGASMRVHSTDFGVTTEQTIGPEGVPLSSNQSMQATLTGGFTFGNGRFASGHSVNIFQERIGDKVYRSWTYSPGIVYRLVPGKITLGASMLNYVRLDTVRSPWYKTPRAWYEGAWGLPRYARAGASWNDTLLEAALPFTFVCDLVYSDVYNRFMVPLGAEVWLTPYLAARMGLNLNHPAEKIHFGTGLRWSNLAFDFDYGITQPVTGAAIEPKWLFGLIYYLKSTAPQKPVVTPVSPKTVPPVVEPKIYAPPKRIMLTPKRPDSLKTSVPLRDSTAVQEPDSTTAGEAGSPDTSGTGALSPAENTVDQSSVPKVMMPSPPSPIDTGVKSGAVDK